MPSKPEPPEEIAALDTELQPWQAALVERMMSGERLSFSLNSGRTAMVRHQLVVLRALGYRVEEHDGYALVYEKATK